MSHGLGKWEVRRLAEKLGQRWLEAIESMSVSEMLIDEAGGNLSEDDFDQLSDEVFNLIIRGRVDCG